MIGYLSFRERDPSTFAPMAIEELLGLPAGEAGMTKGILGFHDILLDFYRICFYYRDTSLGYSREMENKKKLPQNADKNKN